MLNIFKNIARNQNSAESTGNAATQNTIQNSSNQDPSRDSINNVANNIKTNLSQPSLDPPSTLPELAKDIYEKEEPENKLAGTMNPDSNKEAINNRTSIDMASIMEAMKLDALKANRSKVAVEPSKEAVPRLDLNLIRAYKNATKNARDEYSEDKISSEEIRRQSEDVRRDMLRDNSILSSGSQFSYTGSDTGFFKELQDFILTSDLGDSSKSNILDELLGTDLLEKMTVYYNTRNNGLPFYLSNNDLTLATRHTFDELRGMEHSWIINKQKLELVQKLNTELELDIKLKSEELKKLLQELTKRNSIVKPTSNMHDDFNSAGNNKEKFGASTSITDAAKFFYMHDGKILKSVFDLANALKTIDISTFHHHVTDNRNDFASWVGSVFGDAVLAERIRSIKQKEELLIFLKNSGY